MADKAKSEKSCGLNVSCHVERIRASMKESSQDRAKNIDKIVDDAVEGKATGDKS